MLDDLAKKCGFHKVVVFLVKQMITFKLEGNFVIFVNKFCLLYTHDFEFAASNEFSCNSNNAKTTCVFIYIILLCGVLLNLRIYAHLLNEMFCKRQFFLQFSSVCKFDTKTPDKDQYCIFHLKFDLYLINDTKNKNQKTPPKTRVCIRH